MGTGGQTQTAARESGRPTFNGAGLARNPSPVGAQHPSSHSRPLVCTWLTTCGCVRVGRRCPRPYSENRWASWSSCKSTGTGPRATYRHREAEAQEGRANCPKMPNKPEPDLKSLWKRGPRPPTRRSVWPLVSMPSPTWEPTHCLSVCLSVTSSPLGSGPWAREAGSRSSPLLTGLPQGPWQVSGTYQGCPEGPGGWPPPRRSKRTGRGSWDGHIQWGGTVHMPGRTLSAPGRHRARSPHGAQADGGREPRGGNPNPLPESFTVARDAERTAPCSAQPTPRKTVTHG